MAHSTNKAGKKSMDINAMNQTVKKSRVAGHSRYGRSVVSSRTALSSSSKKTTTVGDKSQMRAPVQVFDEAGQDVTPLPLMVGGDPVKKMAGLGDSSGGTPSELMSSASVYQTGTVSTYGGGPFTRSVFSNSLSEKSSESIDDLGEMAADLSATWADVHTQREDVDEQLSHLDLDRPVTLDLRETEMIWLFDQPGTAVSVESDEAAAIKERNEKYKALLKSRVGNDLYVERGMNTFNDPPKLKSVQTEKIGHRDVGVAASIWDMYDTYEAIRLAAEQEKQDAEDLLLSSSHVTVQETSGDTADVERDSSTIVADGSKTSVKDASTTSVKEAISSQTSVKDGDKGGTRTGTESRATRASSIVDSDKDSAIFSAHDSAAAMAQAELDMKIMKSDSLRNHLIIMERVVNLNTYQPKLALYRGLPVIADIDKVEKVDEENKEDDTAAKQAQVSVVNMGPNLDRLWSYRNPMLKGRNVSCVTWNKVNPDLLAVGYGQFEFTAQKGGMVCCWSLKNPEFPERVYTCKSGATSIDFSLTNPNLLAVGFYDGTIAIYNVRNHENESILDSFDTVGKHTAPVWHLKWVEKERGAGDERSEILVSASTDGRITQWSIRKGFECNDLMKLKRVAVKHSGQRGKEKKVDALIQRYAGGFCFDFSPAESTIYLAGTEEGNVHKCSCSYNEQFLDTYIGHTGPVYEIQWSPFVPGVFLSCGADWTVILWHENRQRPIICFHSSTKAVHSICWSPRSSTVFACVNLGAVEVWDLNLSTLDPIIITTPVTGATLSTVTFAKNSECLLVGDSSGQVAVYEVRCMPEPPNNQEEALQAVIRSSLATQLQNASK